MKKSITLVSSDSFSKIASSANDIIYINKAMGDTLGCYNTKITLPYNYLQINVVPSSLTVNIYFIKT